MNDLSLGFKVESKFISYYPFLCKDQSSWLADFRKMPTLSFVLRINYFMKKNQLICWPIESRVCSQPTDPLKPTQSNSTRRVGLVFRAWWVELDYKIFFDSGLGRVWVIKFQTHQTRQTRPDPSIYLIYI